MSNPEKIAKLMDEFVPRISKQVDSVVVLVTYRDDEGQTSKRFRSEGNFYANYGAVSEWLMEMEDQVHNMVKKREDGNNA